jgi:hypothetical protein
MSIWSRAAIHLAYFLPVPIALLWIKPLLAQYLLPKDLVKCDAVAPLRDCTVEERPAEEFIMTETRWLAIRMWLVILWLALRISTTRRHLQAFLATVPVTVYRQLMMVYGRGDLGKGTDPASMQRQLEGEARSVFRALVVATLQYLGPVLWVLGLMLVAVRMGDLDLGVFSLAEEAARGVGGTVAFLATPGAGKASNLDELMSWVLSSTLGVDVSATTLVPVTLWLPLASWLVFWTMLSIAVCSVFGFVYWQGYDNKINAAAEDHGVELPHLGVGGKGAKDE